MRLVWCSCGWELRVLWTSDREIRFAVPTMLDHWRGGHKMRAWSMIRRSFSSAVADYALAQINGMSRAAWEDKHRRAWGSADFETFRP